MEKTNKKDLLLQLYSIVEPNEQKAIIEDFDKWIISAKVGDYYQYKDTKVGPFIDYYDVLFVDTSTVSAYEFCDFFEFTLEKNKAHPFKDEDGNEYIYRATDNQEYFGNRYVNDVTELSDMFVSMEEDYIDSTLMDYNFNGDESFGRTAYYNEALAWIICTEEGQKLKGTDTYDVIRAILCPNLLVDDN